MEHNFSHDYSGQNEQQNITPKCSCGWFGTPVFAWQDYQMHLVKLQENDHLRRMSQEKKFYTLESCGLSSEKHDGLEQAEPPAGGFTKALTAACPTCGTPTIATERGEWRFNCTCNNRSKEAEIAELRVEAPIPSAWWKDCPELAQRTMERIMEKNEQLIAENKEFNRILDEKAASGMKEMGFQEQKCESELQALTAEVARMTIILDDLKSHNRTLSGENKELRAAASWADEERHKAETENKAQKKGAKMRFFCQNHKNANVIFEGSLICPLCEAEERIREDEKTFDDFEQHLNAIEASSLKILAQSKQPANDAKIPGAISGGFPSD